MKSHLETSSSTPFGCRGSYRLEWETSPSSRCATGPLEGAEFFQRSVGREGLCIECISGCYVTMYLIVTHVPVARDFETKSRADVDLGRAKAICRLPLLAPVTKPAFPSQIGSMQRAAEPKQVHNMIPGSIFTS